MLAAVAAASPSHKPAAHETLSENSRQYGEEIKGTGNPGLETRRRFCNPFHHYRCVHTLFSSCELNQMHANQMSLRPENGPKTHLHYLQAIRRVRATRI